MSRWGWAFSSPVRFSRAGSPVRGAEYAVNGVLFGLFGLFAVRREHIDVGRLLRSVVKR